MATGVDLCHTNNLVPKEAAVLQNLSLTAEEIETDPMRGFEAILYCRTAEKGLARRYPGRRTS